MTKTMWHKKYKKKIKEMLNCSDKFANNILDSHRFEIDYESDPVKSAEDEVNEWYYDLLK